MENTLEVKKKSLIDEIMFWGLCILIFYPPYFRGLFFEKEWVNTHIITFVLATIWLIGKVKDKEFKLLNSIPDILGLGMVAMYFISIFYGVDTRAALMEFFKYANYYVLYLITRYFVGKDSKNRNVLLNVLIISGIGVCIISIGAAIGSWSYNGAFEQNRIYGTLQYPNALASYTFALFIVSLGMTNMHDNKKKYLYTSCASIFFFTFVATFSRGMWLIAPFIYIVYIVCVPNKLKSFVKSMGVIIPSVVGAALFVNTYGSENQLVKWLIFILTIVANNLLAKFIERNSYKIENSNNKKRAIALGIIASIFIVGMIVAFNITEPIKLSNIESEKDKSQFVDRKIYNIEKNSDYTLTFKAKGKLADKPFYGRIHAYGMNEKGERVDLNNMKLLNDGEYNLKFTTMEDTEFLLVRFENYYVDTEVIFEEAILYDENNNLVENIKLKYKFIPESIINRINSISVNDRSAIGRFGFYKDALKIIKNNMIFGVGGGGWENTYTKYQSYDYSSTQAHSSVLQLWIEIGTVGFVLFVSFVLILFLDNYREFKKEYNTRVRTVRWAVTVGWMAILIHSLIDFDLSLGSVSICMFVLFALSNQRSINISKLKHTTYIWATGSVSIAILAIMIFLAAGYSRDAIRASESGDFNKMVASFEQASKLDFLNSKYHVDLANLYRMAINSDEKYKEKAIYEINKAKALNDKNPRILFEYAKIQFKMSNYVDALDTLDKIVEITPMKIENYNKQLKSYIEVVKYMANNGKQKEIDNLKNRMIKAKENLVYNANMSLKEFKYNKELFYNLQNIDYIIDNIDNVENLKKVDKVVLYKKFDYDLRDKSMPYGTKTSKSKGGNMKVNKNADSMEITNNGHGHGIFWIHDLSLEKEKEYNLSMEYSSTTKPNNMDVYLYDYSEDKSRKLSKFDNIGGKSDFKNINIGKIKTDDKIISSKQRLGIVHRGKDNGKITIKKIIIMKE